MTISIGHKKVTLDIDLTQLYAHSCMRSTFKRIQEGDQVHKEWAPWTG